jgi:arsenate reductase (thioredoxin)
MSATVHERSELRILVLCTGNSCRSQIAAGLLKSFDARLDVVSAGTVPAPRIHPDAVRVMNEVGIDISGGRPRHTDEFLAQPFDYVITVCDDADRNCPFFTGKVGKRMHIGFADPALATGTDEEILAIFRKCRGEIQTRFRELYDQELKAKL